MKTKQYVALLLAAGLAVSLSWTLAPKEGAAETGNEATASKPTPQLDTTGARNWGGPGRGAGRGWRGGMGARGAGHSGLAADFHQLAWRHEDLNRAVEHTPQGVRAATTTSDPELLALLRRHVNDMKALYANGGGMRRWDPLFRELAAAGDKLNIEVRDIENGVEVETTADDPNLVKLVQAHADKVTSFVADGPAALCTASSLPENYEPQLPAGWVRGAGRGQGPMFADDNNDGVCDHWREGGRGQGAGMGRGQGRGAGMGRGQGAGLGRGQGRGQGQGQGRGMGRCQKQGCQQVGAGCGAGMGRGQGAGMGRGQGAGMGRGRGAGMGRGQGAGMGCGKGAGMGRGKGAGLGRGQSAGLGCGQGRGQGQGHGRGARMGGGGQGRCW